jgi:hypothetical protein
VEQVFVAEQLQYCVLEQTQPVVVTGLVVQPVQPDKLRVIGELADAQVEEV